MEKRRKFITVIIIIILGIGLIYIVYRFHKAYKNIKGENEKVGYKTPITNILTPVFTNGGWKRILIDADITYTDGAHNIVPYDLDNDGNIELIANSYRSDKLLLYKFDRNLYNTSNFSRYVIDFSVGRGIPRKPISKYFKSILKEKLLRKFIKGAHYTAISDINGDGRDDLIVAGDMKRYDVVWYKTPEDIWQISGWEKHILYKNDSHRTYHVEAGDIDGDGDQDVVFTTKTDNSIGWLNNNGSPSGWPATWIDNNCIRCFNARVADIDKDGQNDIIASEDDSVKGGKLHFYRYLNNPILQEEWIDHTIVSFQPGHGVSIFEIIDVDNDGDLDIVTGNHQGDVYVLENPYPHKMLDQWEKYKVTEWTLGSGHDFREIDVGDIDNDGDKDIIVADEGQNMIIWYENPGIAFSENWKPHIIDNSKQYLKWCHFVELGDIDHDGDLDIAVAAAASNTFLLYFNNLKREHNNLDSSQK